MIGFRAGSREPGTGILVLAILLAMVAEVVAQDAGRIPDPGSRVAVEPLRCWRQSSAGAVPAGLRCE